MSVLLPRKVRPARIAAWLAEGWRRFRAAPGVALLVAAPPTLIGAGLLVAFTAGGHLPLLAVLGGGFMLLGPVLIAGHLGLARALAAGRAPRFADFAAGYRRAPPGLWGLAGVTALLFAIWVTDMAVVYGMFVDHAEGRARTADVIAFLGWGGLAGLFFALTIFVCTAFAVPLLAERRATLPQAVASSVRAVGANPVTMAGWGCTLAGAVFAAILLPPLLALALPLLAHASCAAYREVFPAD